MGEKARQACKQYLADNHISAALLDKLDTSDPEAFKTAVKAVQSVTDGWLYRHHDHHRRKGGHPADLAFSG